MPNYHNEQDPEVMVERHRTSHRAGSTRHGNEIRALGDLFGRPIADVLTRSFEDSTEHAGELDYWWTKRADQLEADLRRGQEREGQLSNQVNALGETVDTMAATIRTLFREFDRRAKRSGVELPVWLEELRPDAVSEEAPF